MKKNNSGFVLIGVIFLVLFLSIIIGTVMMRSEMRLRDADLSIASNAAFYAAEAGVDDAIFQLRRDPDWDYTTEVWPKELKDAPTATATGLYTIQCSPAPQIDGWDSFWVRSTGQNNPSPGDTFNDVSRDLLARVIVSNPARFLVLTLGNLNVGSGSVINSDMLGGDVNFLVNESLPNAADREIGINGDIYYLSSITGESHPDVIMGAGSSISQSPSITFTGVDTARYQDLSQGAEGYYYDGDLDIDLSDILNLPGSPATVPKIIYATGDITVSGEFDDSILIVAEKTVYIDGDITAYTGGATVPQLGLFANEDVLVPNTYSGDLTVEAFIMADGNGASEGVFSVEAGAGALGTFTFNGAVSARGDGSTTAIDMSQFGNRTYNFNADLENNRSIPFMPFIANIRDWKEIDPTDVFPPA